MALQTAAGSQSAVSAEAEFVRISAFGIVESAERSFALFGAKSSVISQILAVAAESEDEVQIAIPPAVIERAIDFIRALPESLGLPEVTTEPDGSISLDWIASRTRMFSATVGGTSRIAFAWIDGTDRGHGVARFQGDEAPARVIEGIRAIIHEPTAAVRTA